MSSEKKNVPVAAGSVLLIAREEIYPNPDQPRRAFSMDELEGLAQSIHENGMLQPISVRIREGGGYELIAGERRLRAAGMIGMAAVYGLSQEEMALRLGKAQSTLSNKLRLLKLSPRLCTQIERAGLTERHARALLKLEDERERQIVLDRVICDQLNVAQTEKLVESYLKPKQSKKRNIKFLFRDVRIFMNTITHAVDTMRQAGIEADSEKTEDESYITYTVRIPKAVAYRTPASGCAPAVRASGR